MKKILYFNFDVGSGIEYCGNVFKRWLYQASGCEVFEYRNQNQPSFIIDDIIKISPDMVILNEVFDKSCIPTFYYKKFHPETKIVMILHSWKSLFGDFTDERFSVEERKQMYFNRDFFKLCDRVFVLNYHPDNVLMPENVISVYFPVDSKEYHIRKKWKDREKLFVYLGSISPLKFSEDFLDYVSCTGISIDCYGYISDGFEDYKRKFNRCSNIVYKGTIKQENVPDILNEYKYYIMPHNGYEIFNLSLFQSILCGTIPLISNDRNTKQFDYSWIDWADGLYFGCNTSRELVDNIKILCKEMPDHSDISEKISTELNNRYSFDNLRNIFINSINELLGGSKDG